MQIGYALNFIDVNFGQALYDANPLFYRNVASRNRAHGVNSIPDRIPVTGIEG
jgi:hypothetical protein